MATGLGYPAGYGAAIGGPLYSGASVTSLVPGLFPIALDGRPYQIVWDRQDIPGYGLVYKRESLPLLRGQSDQSHQPGEQSISPEQFWRRSQESWHHGCGQSMLDRDDSDELRFRSSKGVNVWTPWSLSLLGDTTRPKTSANARVLMILAGTRVYLLDNNTVQWSINLTSWTTVTGTPANVYSLASDGKNVWMACGTGGVYQTDTGTSAATSLATTAQDVRLVAFAHNRVFASDVNGRVWNITGAGAMTTSSYTGLNPYVIDLSARGFTWVGYAAGDANVYLGGVQGTSSIIFRTTILKEGTALDVPIVAVELPDGETLTALGSYLGYVLVGTSLGMRLAQADANGALVLGALVPVGPVTAFEPQDRFVWFSWTNYDATSTGLGRMDLSVFTGPLTPAYASDVMATAAGTVTSIITLGLFRAFTVASSGVWLENSNPVASGTLDTGGITYGISDAKIAAFVDLKHEPLYGTITVSLTADGLPYTAIGLSNLTLTTSPPNGIVLDGFRGEQYELRFTLTSASNVSPVMQRWTLRSYPASVRSSLWLVPVMLADRIQMGDTDIPMDVEAEYKTLVELHTTQELFVYQEGETKYRVVMDDYVWFPLKPSETLTSNQGTFVAKLREIAG
jgi:hypothetical protein